MPVSSDALKHRRVSLERFHQGMKLPAVAGGEVLAMLLNICGKVVKRVQWISGKVRILVSAVNT